MKVQAPPGGAAIRAGRGVFFVVLALALALVGCVSPRDIRVLQAQLDELQAEQSRLSATLSRLDSLAAGGSGSTREMVVDVKHSMSDMDARLIQMDARLTDLESRSSLPGAGATPGVMVSPTDAGTPAAVPQDQVALDIYEAAFEALKREDHTEAIRGFRQYLQAAPAGSEAASAHFWVGESQYALGNPDSALVSYQAVIDRYPESPKVPAALFKSGSIYEAKGDKEKAYPYFRRLKEEFPQSLEYQQLRRQLEE